MKTVHYVIFSLFLLSLNHALACTNIYADYILEQNTVENAQFTDGVRYCGNIASNWTEELLTITSSLFTSVENNADLKAAISPTLHEAFNNAHSIFISTADYYTLFQRIERTLRYHESESHREILHSWAMPYEFHRSIFKESLADDTITPNRFIALIHKAFASFYIRIAKSLYLNHEAGLRLSAKLNPAIQEIVGQRDAYQHATGRVFVTRLSSIPKFFHPAGLYVLDNPLRADHGTFYEVLSSEDSTAPIIKTRVELAPHCYPGLSLPPATRRKSEKGSRLAQISKFDENTPFTLTTETPTWRCDEGFYLVRNPKNADHNNYYFVQRDDFRNDVYLLGHCDDSEITYL